MTHERFFLTENKNLSKFFIRSSQIHQTENVKYFVPEHVLDFTPAKEISRFIPVTFPESQLFMESYQDEIYLINDEEGINKYGFASYFVEENLYKKILTNFEREQTVRFEM